MTKAEQGDPTKPTDPAQQALGRSRGGFSTKIDVRAEGKDKPITFVLAPGEAHDAPVFEQLMEQGAIKRRGRGRPRLLPGRIAADKGYSSGKIRRYLREHGAGITSPRKSNEPRRGRFDKEVYRLGYATWWRGCSTR